MTHLTLTDAENLLRKMGSRDFRSLGDKIRSTCPLAPWFHKDGKDKHPSFVLVVNGAYGAAYNCSGCAKKGTVRQLLHTFAEQSGQSYRDLKRTLDSDAATSALVNFNVAEIYRPKTQKKSKEFRIEDYAEWRKQIPKYAIERGITMEQVRKYRLGYDANEKRLFIPVFDDMGKMLGWAGRTIRKDERIKYKNAPGMVVDGHFFGEHLVDPSKGYVTLVESFMDVFRLDRVGVANPVSNFGTAFQVDRLDRLLTWALPVIIFPHNDKPNRDGVCVGMKMATSYQEALVRERLPVYVAPVIEGKKDVDEWSDEEIRGQVEAAFEYWRAHGQLA